MNRATKASPKAESVTLDLFPRTTPSLERWANATSTFARNLGLPVHGWYRFPAGFSAEWVRSVVDESRSFKKDVVVLDPFAGVGTAVLAAEEAGVAASGIEAQPFIARVAQAKLLWHTDPRDFLSLARKVSTAARAHKGEPPAYPELMQKCYPPDVLRGLHSLRWAWETHGDGGPASELAWLALVAILRPCSPAGTAPWQYVLPKKSKANALAPYAAFTMQVERIARDMASRQHHKVKPTGRVYLADARDCQPIPDASVNLVVTSPPYPNNYDYADATRLEMTFFGEVKSWGDLHDKVRRGLIRSCSQHVSTERPSLGSLLDQLSGTSISDELRRVCEALRRERLRHGGKKDYHLMVAAYFADMNRVWQALHRVCMRTAKICFVVGDSAPYGIHVPVDRWLGELALSAGFRACRFEKIRDRNVKWLNRKHRVPLSEGRLWVEG